MPRPAYNHEKRERAKELYLDRGMSLRAIAAELGVSHERVRQYLDELGVRRRPQGRPRGEVGGHELDDLLDDL